MGVIHTDVLIQPWRRYHTDKVVSLLLSLLACLAGSQRMTLISPRFSQNKSLTKVKRPPDVYLLLLYTACFWGNVLSNAFCLFVSKLLPGPQWHQSWHDSAPALLCSVYLTEQAPRSSYWYQMAPASIRGKAGGWMTGLTFDTVDSLDSFHLSTALFCKTKTVLSFKIRCGCFYLPVLECLDELPPPPMTASTYTL